MLSEEELNELAIKVSARLNGTEVTRLIPRTIQEDIKTWTQGFPYKNQFVMPIGSGGIMVEMEIQPDGSLKMILSDFTHVPFWNAHLKAE